VGQSGEGAARPLDQFRLLIQVSRLFTYAVCKADVLQIAVTRAAELFSTRHAILLLPDEAGVMSVAAAHGIDAEALARFSAATTEPLNLRLDHLLAVGIEKFLGVPLVSNGQVTGILAVSLAAASATDSDQESLLSALADQVAVALEKAHLDEAARYRERLIGIVSHDLRSPLTAILATAQTLLRRTAVGDSAHQAAERIEACAQRATRMVRDLLDYTQIHLSTGLVLQRRPMDLHQVLRQTVQELLAGHPGRSTNVRMLGEAHGIWDADRLAQMVENLLGNALTYSPVESIIGVTCSADDHGVHLKVKNDGPPIAAQRLAHIFDAMQRGVHGNNPQRSLGLGLFIVKGIVEAHGGTIEVTSTLAEGTTFTVWLPISVGRNGVCRC
jgi:sigma-B regulation protein RsbU (phosphoserine phosphatase)